MAGGASDIRAGGAFVELFTKNSRLRKGLSDASGMFKGFAASVGAVALGGLLKDAIQSVGSALASAFSGKEFAEFGSELNDMSARTGVSVEALGELKYAANQTGTELSTVELGIRKMQKTIADAAAGSKQGASALAKLGLSASDLSGKTPEKQFELMAERIRAIQDPAERAAAAMAVFGKSGTQLIPLMQQFDELAARARELGVVMSTEDAAKADALGDSFDDLKSSLGGVVNTIGATFAPMMKGIVDNITSGLVAVREWISENEHMLDSTLETISGITAAIGAGEFGLAMDVGGKAMQVAWQGALLGMSTAWNEWATPFQQSAIETFFGVAQTISEAFDTIPESLQPIITKILRGLAMIQDAMPGLDKLMGLKIGDDMRSFADFLDKPKGERDQFLGTANSMAKDDMAKQNQAALDARKAELEKAKEALAKANEAANKFKAPERAVHGKTPLIPPVADVQAAAAEMAMKFASAGTFSAAGAQGLAGTTWQDIAKKQLKATEKQQKTLEQIAKNTDNGDGGEIETD